MNYRIKRHFSLIGHDPNHVELRAGIWNPTSFFIHDQEETGKLYAILRDLNGNHSSRDIADKHAVSLSQVESVIDHLQSLDVLETGDSHILDHFITQCSPLLSGNGYRVEKKPRKILLLGNLSPTIATLLEPSLPEDALQLSPLYDEIKNLQESDWLHDGVSYFGKIASFAAWKDYFIVIAHSFVDLLFLKNFNRIASELDIPWMNVAIDGPFLFIGPIFQKSPCFECLEKRVMMNLRESASYQKYKEALLQEKVSPSSPLLNPVITSMIASHAAFDILNFILTKSAFTLRKLLSIYLPTMEFVYHELFPLPSCPVCGPTLHRTDQELYFDMQTLLETR